ncbi:type II toxin-antitoxin system HigB family toxin [Marinoscillum sp.]|uniref:type II toxin-antitoxin system HigB family toxin n=1 Tax=Marinoscillum sp. TaxID=2024838 RepID=UPI003BAC3CB1
MKVHLIKKQTIEDYTREQARSKVSFGIWLEILKGADWDKSDDIKKTFGSADLLGNGCDRVVFNIGGNNYRLICKYLFGAKAAHLFVCWIGTHAEYDRLCGKNEQYTVNDY